MSRDGGRSFTEPTPLTGIGTPTTQVSVAAYDTGAMWVAWEESEAEVPAVRLARVMDDGVLARIHIAQPRGTVPSISARGGTVAITWLDRDAARAFPGDWMMRINRGIVVALATFFAVGCGGDGEETRLVRVGSPAPAFAARTMDGDTLRLADLRGTPVMLNIWATWCAPCREEMPDLQAIQDDYANRGLQILVVSIDESYAREDVRKFLADHDITMTSLLDPEGRVTRTFRTIGVPETFLIGADGTLQARWIGQIDPVAVRRELDERIG